MNIRLGPSGIHFFDRSTGTNVLLDEVRVPREAWHRAPRQVSIALTNACDLSCSYCYAPKTSAMLNVSDVKRWLDELSTAGCLGIGFGGGEPTLHNGLVELCRFVTRRTRMAATFTTHGHHLNSELLESLRENINFVRVSMDGVHGTYERLRRRPFHQLIQKLKLLSACCAFGINFVVNSETIADLQAAVEIAGNLGAREFLLLPEHKTAQRPGIRTCELKALADWALAYRGAPRLTISETVAEGFCTCDPFHGEFGLRGYAHIDATGILKRHSYDEDGVAVGPNGVLAALDTLTTTFQKY